MRDLDAADLGVLLSFFVVLLIFFSVDFHISRRHKEKVTAGTRFFAIVSAVGGAVTAVALVLTWVALFLPTNMQAADVPLVFVPGSIAIACGAILSIEVVLKRVIQMRD